MKKGKFEVYKDRKKQWRWRLKASNGRVIAQGESYKSRTATLNGINSVMCFAHVGTEIAEV